MRLLNLSGPQDLMALLVRRKNWILYPFVALSLAAAVLAMILPKVYESKATIMIRPREIPTDFVKDLTAGSTESRLSAIEQTVLSRTNLTQIAINFEGRFPEFKNMEMDARVARLRRQILLNFRTNENAGGQLPVTYFTVGFQNRDPKLAQEIAVQLTNLFMKKDAAAHEEQVRKTVEFLTAELNKVYIDMKASDAKVKALKSRHRHEMPNQLETNLRRFESLGATQQSREEQSLTIEQLRRQFDQALRDTPPLIPKPVKPVVPVEVDEVEVNPQIAEYKALKAQLKDLDKRGVGEKNPNFLIVKRQLDELAKEMSPEDIALAEKKEEKPKPKPKPKPEDIEMMDNPRYLAIMQEKSDFERRLAILDRKNAQADKEIDVIAKRIDIVPQVEEEFGDIGRENADLNKQYNKLKDNLETSELSLSLEFQQKGAGFEVLDAADEPSSPTKPQKSKIVALGALISLLGGVVIGVATDVANQKMWTASDVETFLGATVLVEIPEIVTPADIVASRKKKWRHIIALTVTSVVYVAALYFVYLHQSFVVRQLEPYLQRLY